MIDWKKIAGICNLIGIGLAILFVVVVVLVELAFWVVWLINGIKLMMA